MNRHPSEPLTQEERELAQLIARVGPHGEPPTALDAKILAAAHAAVAGKPQHGRKPRWPVAIGLAASMVLAVGIAWQLRPVQPVATASSEVPGPVAAEMMTQTEAEPAPPPPPQADVVAQDPAIAADVPMTAPPPPPPAAKSLPPRAVSMPSPRRTVRPPQAPPVQRQAQGGDRYRSLGAVPPPPAPPAPVMAAPEPATESPAAFAPDPHGAAIAGSLSAYEAADYSARAAAVKQSAARAEMKASPAIREQAIREQERSAQEHSTQDRTTLDRVEVTGSRLQRTDRQVPISDDARLPVDEWLERVRTRYGLGDAEAAKRSLLLFVKDHPHEAVPGDLEPLLEK